MIDFLFGCLVTSAAFLIFTHFKGASLKAPDLLSTFENRIKTIMSQVADDLAAKIAALPAEFETAFNAKLSDLQGRLDAETADHAADLQKLNDAVSAITPEQSVG